MVARRYINKSLMDRRLIVVLHCSGGGHHQSPLDFFPFFFFLFYIALMFYVYYYYCNWATSEARLFCFVVAVLNRPRTITL